VTPLRLTTWFRKRMLAVVAATAVPMAMAAPIAFFVQKRQELLTTARGQAAQVAEVVRTAVDERPRLWRYDATKLGARLAAEGLDRAPLRVFAGGVEVPIERVHPGPPPRWPMWGRFDLRMPHPVLGKDQVAASIWVAVDARPLATGTAALALLFALLAAGLGTVLYLLPVRAIGLAERRVHQLLGQLALTLQEEDRRRISRDLHDGAGQAITAARLELLALAPPAVDGEGEGATRRERLTLALGRVAAHLDEALAEVRRSTTALAPPALAELGFARAVERHCEAFADAVGLRVDCSVATGLPPLGAHVELACYRIVQEALANVARHAGAAEAGVAIAIEGGHLRLRVSDDGKGLDDDSDEAPGHGLANIRERARLLGGDLRIGARRGGGRGLELEVSLPLQEVRA
jgi:signal transduction histidine kinase